MGGLILERCCTSAEQALEALENGAARVELCHDLSIGGVTPEHNLILAAVKTGIPVNVLIRPRGGNFVYSVEEIQQMISDIEFCRSAGVNGVVIGILHPDGSVNLEAMRLLIAAAQGMSITFHRAFDRCSNPQQALEDIISLGCNRLLTSGLQDTAPQGQALIAELVKQAAGRIIIMPGSGVTPENINSLAAATGAREFHGTRLATCKK